MNVGAMLSMQNVGQLSGKGVLQKPQVGEGATLFSSILHQAGQTEETIEKLEVEMIQLLKILNVLQTEEQTGVNVNETSDISMDDLLLEAGLTQEDFITALVSVKDDIEKQVPHLKEMFAQLEEGNKEEILFELIEIISVLPADNLKKLGSPSMEILMKTSKAFQHAFRQIDLNFQQTEKADALQQNLKVIAQKVEQLLSSESLRNGKWTGILEKVFQENINSKQSSTIPNTSVINKSAITLPTLAAALIKTPQVITGEQPTELEGEQSAKLNAPTSLSAFANQQQMTRVEQFSLFVNKGHQGTTYEQFVKEFANIIGKSQMVQTPNMSKLLIKLYPEQLGSIRIELLQQDGIMTAKILASTKAAKDILDSQLTGLRQALNSQNLQVEKIEIAQTFTESQKQERQSAQQHNGQQQKEQSNQESNNKEEPETTFKELLMNSEV